jgi:predicted nicotinamide N-methyase
MAPSTSDPADGAASGLTRLLAPVEIAGLRLHVARPGAAVGRLAAAGSGLAPYWAFAWPGGRALALFLKDHPEWVSGKRVIDFGCGCGLVALAAARAGAAAVHSVDIDPLARELTSLNAAENGFAIGVSDGSEAIEADIVLAGDVFYAPDVARNSMRLLAERVTGGAVVLIGDPGRNDLPTGMPMLAQYELADIGTTEVRSAAVYRLAL